MDVAAAGAAARPVAGRFPSLLTCGALVFAGSTVLNLGGFAFHAVAGRWLGPHEYGMLYAAMSLATIAALPSALAAPAVSRLAAEYYARDVRRTNRLARDLSRLVAIAAALYVAAFALLGPLLAAKLHLPVMVVWLCGPIAAVVVASAAFRALAQGAHRFGIYALSASGEGIAKVAAIVAFATAGMGLVGGVLGFLVGAACGALVALVPVTLAMRGPVSSEGYDRAAMLASGGGAAAMVIVFSLMGYADVVLVTHYFNAQQTGIYAAAALVGKIVLYLVGFVPVVLLPAATVRYSRGEASAGALRGALGVFAVLTAVSLGVIAMAATPLLHLLLGGAFDGASGLLTWYAVAMALLALTNLVASYGIATRRVAFALPTVAGACLTLGAIGIFHASLLEVVRVMVVGNAAIALAAVAAVALQSLREGKASA
ncbi:MAG TPA: hypothetical protein VMV82_08420 [Candidatus Dormibacteraeota bacterium]|nr:hypothetical protein [Candidatus Dormibacteraeota bacterium]